MSIQHYSINPNKPAFAALDDDDDVSAFMNSSSASYLAADRLPHHEKVLSPHEQERNNVLQQIQKTEQRTLDSSKRSLQALAESEKIGIETAEDLSRQREQLQNTETRLDDINSTLKDTQKNINSIKSVFSSIKQWWNTPKKPPTDKDTVPSADSLTSSKSADPIMSKHLSSAVEHSKATLEMTRGSDIHPALKLRGLAEEEKVDPELAEIRAQSRKVNERLDDDLLMMSSGLSRLKDLATGLGNEIEDQNTMLDRITVKADRADLTIHSQNSQMNRILKR